GQRTKAGPLFLRPLSFVLRPSERSFMARRRKRPARNSPLPEGMFRLGQRVRVKQGIVSTELPRIDLGGWPGVIRDTDAEQDPPTYLVEFPAGPLQAANPRYGEACEAGNLEYGLLWMAGDDLEPAREALSLPADQQVRLRQVLGVPPGGALPGL